ncbi:MAG TPA: hybrid sensor histidine kinase/response regulator [Kofleriaceae bacterium]|jgi:two-component system sensor histidine kinase/response regulator
MTRETSGEDARILLVDDDARIRRSFAEALLTEGYQVVTAEDGLSGVARANETPPDILLCDVEMPTMSGLELVRHVKRQYGAAVHAIVMTGHDDESHRAEAFAAGANDFLAKPLERADVLRRVRAAAATQRAFVAVRHEKEGLDRRITYGVEASALLAHDLNNGLAVALSNVQFLQEEQIGNPEQRAALDSTLRSLRRMSGLVANFVDIVRFEDADLKPMVSIARVATVLESVSEVAAATLSRGIRIRIECPEDLEGRFDEALVERVLHNLVGNATRYCNPGGEIVVTAARGDGPDSVVLRIRNTGPQVPETLRGSLFGKYARGTGGKRGMGLYFCRLVAEAHDGRIEYEATATGPSFVIALPGTG